MLLHCLTFFVLHLNSTFYLQIGDIRSDHNYPAAMSSGATASRASVCSEFGGLGLFTAVLAIPPHLKVDICSVRREGQDWLASS